jgi:hypothetical protein
MGRTLSNSALNTRVVQLSSRRSKTAEALYSAPPSVPLIDVTNVKFWHLEST